VDESEATGASISPSSTTDTPGSLTNPLPLNPADNKPPHKRIVDEMLHCIDVAADFEVGLETKNAHSPVRQDVAVSEGAIWSATSRRTWVAVKMTALLPSSHALIAWSSHITASRKSLPPSTIEATVPFPGTARIEDMDVILRSPAPNSSSSLSTSHPPLTHTQIYHIRELYTDLVRICTHAKEKGVKVIVDAEYRCDIFSVSYLNMGYL
jgi:proline dehydrogenase